MEQEGQNTPPLDSGVRESVDEDSASNKYADPSVWPKTQCETNKRGAESGGNKAIKADLTKKATCEERPTSF